MTITKSLEIDKHPLPRPNELFAAFTGGVKFLKMDLTQVYQQMILDKDSRVYVTINTHLGLLRLTTVSCEAKKSQRPLSELFTGNTAKKLAML